LHFVQPQEGGCLWVHTVTRKLSVSFVRFRAPLREKFNEFENIANKILDTKSEKFTELNKTNLQSVFRPSRYCRENSKQSGRSVSGRIQERFSLEKK
jgi:DNA anti-recombination protein RmuC